MLHGSVRFQVSETEGLAGRPRSASAMAELFTPLNLLLAAGGDTRLTINPASGLNEYGCRPSPCPETLSFSSSTATAISARACHFSVATANGSRVQKGEPITGLASALTSVALPLSDGNGQPRAPAANDATGFDAVERA